MPDAQSSHSYAYAFGVLRQAPLETVKVVPSRAVPEIAGAVVAHGAEPLHTVLEATAAVGDDVADADPAALDAVTVTSI